MLSDIFQDTLLYIVENHREQEESYVQVRRDPLFKQ